MTATRSEKIAEIIQRAAAEYLSRESNRVALITVTAVRLSNDEKYATILFTVLPTEKEQAALEFAKRMRSDFREYVTEKTKIGRVPFFDFAIDEGEKHRQTIDRLSLEH